MSRNMQLNIMSDISKIKNNTTVVANIIAFEFSGNADDKSGTTTNIAAAFCINKYQYTHEIPTGDNSLN